MPPNAKKQPVKRKNIIKRAEADFKQELDELLAVTPTSKLDETAFLSSVVEGIEQMDNDQKSRFINYIYSRYWKYITLTKLTK